MNRRNFIFGGLSASVGLMGISTPLPATTIIKPTIVEPPKSFFTHKNFSTIKEFALGKTSQETIDENHYNWNEGLNIAFSLATCRLSNIMHRKTLDGNSKYWMVMSPKTCSRKIWADYQFGQWNEDTNKFVPYNWMQNAKYVSPGVYHVGSMCQKWKIYVDEQFQDNLVIIGLGERKVIRYKFTEKRITETIGDIKYDRPEVIAYLGAPTKHNYTFIHLKEES